MNLLKTRDALNEQIEHFFTHPNRNADPPLSTLYLLRRDLRFCLGEESSILNESPALFSSLLTLFAEIDLLSKFYGGNDYPQKVRVRFKYFTERYFSLSDYAQEVIYLLRNSLVYSLNLYSRISQGSLIKFTVNNNLSSLYYKDNGVYNINTKILNCHLEDAINRYHADLQNDEFLQKKFKSMYDIYGMVPPVFEI